MSDAKVQLSDAEIRLFGNAEIILTKNHILQQTKELLQGVQEQMQEAAQWPHPELFSVPPKISRGENYAGLPYLVLDYPRNFGTPDIFAIRSFFWWGHFFSSTLHLSGSYCSQYRHLILAARQILADRGFYLHTGPDPWAHHFAENNYTPIAGIDADAFCSLLYRQAPIKIAAKWPLDQWPFAANLLLGSWRLLLNICLDQLPSR